MLFYSIFWLILDIIFVNSNFITIEEFGWSSLLNGLIYQALGLMVDYWFFGIYLLLLILSPLFNIAFERIKKKWFLMFNIILFSISFICSFLDSVLTSTLLWMITCYFSGAFIGKYKDDIKVSTATLVIILLICILLSFSIELAVGLASKNANLFFNTFFLYNQTSPLCYFIACILILIADRVQFHSYTVNFIGSAMPGIYLLHDPYSRTLVWKILGIYGKDYTLLSSGEMFLSWLQVTVIIVGVGLVIEFIRQTIEVYAIVPLMKKMRIPKEIEID